MPYTSMFTPGWASRAALLPYDISGAGARASVTNPSIPLLAGSSYNDPDNTRIEMLAQGAAAGAWPVNFVPGIHTPSLYITCRPTVNWFTAANLKNLFLNRNANGEQNPVDTYYNGGGTKDTPAGTASIRTWGRVANFSLSASSRQGGGANCAMNVLLTDQAMLGADITDVTAAAYPAQTGATLFWRGFQFNAITLTTAGITNVVPDQVEDVSMSVFTGAMYGKTMDGTLYTNVIDSGVQTGSFVVTQRQTASNPLHAAGTIVRVQLAQNFYPVGTDASPSVTVYTLLDLVRTGYEESTVFGNKSWTSTWSIFSYTGNNPVSISATAQ